MLLKDGPQPYLYQLIAISNYQPDSLAQSCIYLDSFQIANVGHAPESTKPTLLFLQTDDIPIFSRCGGLKNIARLGHQGFCIAVPRRVMADIEMLYAG